MSLEASFGHLALIYAGKFLPVEILHSAAGATSARAIARGRFPVSRASTSAAKRLPSVLSNEAAGHN